MDLLSKRTDPTGSAAAEAALQQHTFTERLRTIASRRSTDATGTSSTDGVVTSPSAASAVSSAGLQSRIQPGAPLPHLESELLLNGAPLSRSAFMKLSAYVPQVCCAGKRGVPVVVLGVDCWVTAHCRGCIDSKMPQVRLGSA
jgi:hypothetical protein